MIDRWRNKWMDMSRDRQMKTWRIDIDLRKIDEEIDGLKDRQIDGEMERVMLK